MRPKDIQPIGTDLAISWEDGAESFIPLSQLRRYCPCAGCKGEVDVMGNLYINPQKPLNAASVRLRKLDYVGGYGVQPTWEDGHSTGIYSFDYLREIAKREIT